METLKYFFRSLIEWVFRRRSLALYVMRAGLACVALAFGASWVWDVSIPVQDGQLKLSVDSAGGTPTLIVYGTWVVGLVLLVGGLLGEIWRREDKQKLLNRKKVIVVESRGLRDVGGSPLVEAIPESMGGHRDHVLIDIRQHIKDGEITDPEAALEDLISLPNDLKRKEAGFDRRDLTLVYGGLTPVPFTFLIGVLMDDENMVNVFDWDRHTAVWRSLEGSDDGKRFKCTGANNIPSGTPDVALAVSVSYSVRADDVWGKVGDIPLVLLNLEHGSSDCHWSKVKQQALGRQFHHTVKDLGNLGVKRIHLFLAAQNSVVFRFGQLYDKRNLPEVIVYQYLKAETPPYPWGILMPACGVNRPVVVKDA